MFFYGLRDITNKLKNEAQSKERENNLDLNPIIGSVENDLEVLIEQKRASIKYENIPTIEGIDFLLYQLFYNLINNSLKFSKEVSGV
ncbi:MAG: hypothetical protein ACR2KZ_02860 [Segetibacter sp.]